MKAVDPVHGKIHVCTNCMSSQEVQGPRETHPWGAVMDYLLFKSLCSRVPVGKPQPLSQIQPPLFLYGQNGKDGFYIFKWLGKSKR